MENGTLRQIVLDTETTGLEPALGHKIIEIGCVELVRRRLTGNHYHQYLNPDREIEAGAVEVHGISNEFVADKPRFAEVCEDFLAFVDGAELIIHNAPFDVGFLNHELSGLPGQAPIESRCRILDTLEMARKLHPGQRNSLDALCKRYGVDNSRRELHGALLDAEILADVYLAMTGGQSSLALEPVQAQAHSAIGALDLGQRRSRGGLRVIRASAEEVAAHEARLDEIEKAAGVSLWRRLGGEAID